MDQERRPSRDTAGPPREGGEGQSGSRDGRPPSRFASGAQRGPGGDRSGGDRSGGDRFGGGGDREERGGDRPGGDRRGGGRGGGGFGGRGGPRGRKEPVFGSDEFIDYKDMQRLRRCLDERGRITHRRKTGCRAGQQRDLTIAVKRARHMALLPYVSDGRK